jgi:hypothetical protein
MEKDVQESPPPIARRLSYCEVNANAADNLRLGAGPPDEILRLPDEVANIRFFMLEPIEGTWLRTRWYRGEVDEAGKLTTHPFAHPSQEAGAWGGFLVPLVPLAARIAQGIVAGGSLDAASDGSTTWVRVQRAGLTVARLPGPPTLASLLEDQPESRWWPVYVRLFGDRAKLGDLLVTLGREYIPPLGGGEPDP